MTRLSETVRLQIAEAAAGATESAEVRALLDCPTQSVTVRLPERLVELCDRVATAANDIHPSGAVTRTDVIRDLLVAGIGLSNVVQ